MNKALKFAFFCLLVMVGCKDKVQNTIVIYNNDFEKQDLSGISNGSIVQYNGSSVLGRYNNGGFTLTVNNLPKHSLITISFDLYIHDTWDGNKPAPDGPDIWQMVVNNNTYINTTFSNSDCKAGYICPPQSFPFDYPNNYNNPKTGAYKINLPGVCAGGGTNTTSQYKIVKTIVHNADVLTLQCLDKLVQTNTPDPKCDESWSVDNISIKAVTL